MVSEKQPEYVDATFYAVVTPVWAPTWKGKDDRGRRLLEGAKVDRITQNKPQTIKGGAVLTRLTLRMDPATLLPLEPQAVIHVSPGQIEIIEVQADAPEPEAES